MRLSELLPGQLVLGNPAAEVGSLAFHSEQIRPDCVFFKCGYYGLAATAAEAVARGARHVVLRQGDPEGAALPAGVSRTYVANVQQAYAVACANFFGNVHRKLTLIGVTGTKGKTTACHLVEAALRHGGVRAGLISSAARQLPKGRFRATNTTPAPFALHQLFSKIHEQGGTHVVLEVSSIAIAEARVHGLRFAALAFTNLGTDHLEFHGGRDAYLAAKRRLFDEPLFHASAKTLCAVNADDPSGREIAASAAGRVLTFGLRDADLVPESYSYEATGMRLRVEGHELHLPLFGEHNVSNALAAFALAREVLGSAGTAVSAMRYATPLPGRLERVPTGLPLDVYVDYAHTPESVAAALRAVDAVAPSRKRVAVIGCSGNSDRGKRPLIARAAAAGADACIFASDNPGHEDPEAILGDMIAGLDAVTAASGRVRAIADRASAIAAAIDLALPDGTVVLMGKGSETVQLVRGERRPHSDLEVAAHVLRSIEGQQRERLHG